VARSVCTRMSSAPRRSGRAFGVMRVFKMLISPPMAVALVVVAAVLVLYVLSPSMVSSGPSASTICINNLRQLDGAKQVWALTYHKSTNDIPTMEDLRPWLKRQLVCPKGGTYIPGRVCDPPRCSLGGSHTLPP
jgi:hypothetical protein